MDNPGGMMFQNKVNTLYGLPREEQIKKFTEISSIYEKFIDYNPSNGLISDGDIHVLGP